MITTFSVVYPGTIDMDALGRDGTPANDRSYSNERLAEALDNSLAYAQLLERLGYDILWMAEHHFQHEGYECVPNILMLSVHLANHTKRIKFGCGFNILPMWHPLRLAEDFAVADILTGGRVIFGLGRGYHSREVETFGAPMLDQDANRELFEEQIEVIFKAFEQDSFSHHGKHYHIPPEVPYRGYNLKEITLVPRPIHQPVETWQPIVSASTRGMDFMAKYGVKGFIGSMPEARVDTIFHEYQAANARCGRELELGEGLSLSFRVYIDDTLEKAQSAVTPYFEEGLKFAAPLGTAGPLNQEQVEAVVNPSIRDVLLPTIADRVQSRAWLCGPSEAMVTHIKGVEQRYPGLTHLNVSADIGTPRAVFMEQLQRFAEEVMPAFRDGKGSGL